MNALNRFALLLALCASCWPPRIVAGEIQPRAAADPSARAVGEYGYRLDLLRRYYSGPREKGESNHFIDMWGKESLREFAFANGLTNNRALFVISHGKAIFASGGRRYAYYPDKDLWPEGRIPYFSAKDLAETLGPKAAKGIHNLVIAGCNAEGVFSPEELRFYFVNATNVIHTPARQDGNDLIFRHTLIHRSSDIQFLYAMPRSFTTGKFEDERNSKQAGLYKAQLYRPGEKRPFKTQIAGRELLEPSSPKVKGAPLSGPKPTPETEKHDLMVTTNSAAASTQSDTLILRGEKLSAGLGGLIARVAGMAGFQDGDATSFEKMFLILSSGLLAACVTLLFLRVLRSRRAAAIVLSAPRSMPEAGALLVAPPARWSDDIVPLRLKSSAPSRETAANQGNRRS